MESRNVAYSANAEARQQALAINKVIRNTFMLLSMTLLVSTITALYAMASNAAPVNIWVMFGAFLGGPILIHFVRNSAISLPLVFLWTGFMGYILGPILNFYLSLPNGDQIVTTSLGLTALIFFGLTFYAMTTRRDFSFLSGFLTVGALVILAAILGNYFFFQMPALSLAISAGAVILISGFMLFDVSRMVNGGETNYVTMTVALFSNIYVLFLHLLNLVSAFTGND
ncbi:MAG: Bax inhibitor-1/YccA family protein [Gammaproteobacteria bacterium]|nr:Bax inhibitor-1/YccA family protein [Gammaproteobacteria bacterium]MDX5375790.1 Bax inhibitor-1/YccA family protein [Gammaproteobacteria bacterium]